MKVVVIGGNAAGMSAASRLKRKAQNVEVVVFEKSSEVSYGACGLPYYIGDENPDVDLVRIRKPEQFLESGIQLYLKSRVDCIDIETKQLTVTEIESNIVRNESYDKLIIASGASPIIPEIPGAKLKNVFSLKTISDAENIKQCLEDENIKRIAIVGAGYIGLELAEAVARNKKKAIEIFEAANHCLPSFDPEFGDAVQKELNYNGVQVHTGETVCSFCGSDTIKGIMTASGAAYDVDMAIIAIGVRPNTSFISSGKIETLRNGAIITDAAMRSSVNDVYAAGDCSTVQHKLLDKPVYIPLATNANKQGRFVADSVLGLPVKLKRALGTSALRCMGLELGKTGLTQKEALQEGIPAETVVIQNKTHARYYPGNSSITIKLCYHSDTKVLLGAQLMGEKETAWRTNVFACAIDQGMTSDDLGCLDLAYCPIISTVWDPILIAANAIK